MRGSGWTFLVSAAAAVGLVAAGPATRPAPLAEVPAFLLPSKDLELATEVAGVIERVHVDEGAAVDATDTLVELKADLVKAQLAVSEGRVAAARVEIRAADTTLRTRQAEYEREERLLREGAGTVEARDKAKLEMELARLAVDRAQEQHKIAELAAERDREALRQTVIRAPIAGQVFRVLKHEGESVEENRPVLRLVSVDPLDVIAYLPIETAGAVRPGLTARLVLENRPAEPVACVVTVVDPVADPASGMYRVKLTLPNSRRTYTAGAKGTLTIEAGGSAPAAPHGQERKE